MGIFMNKFCYQEFEVWLLDNFGWTVSRNESGEISNVEVYRMFQVWKAAWAESRGSLLIQLPPDPVLGSNAEWYQGYAGGWSACRAAVKNIGKQEGIKFEERRDGH